MPAALGESAAAGIARPGGRSQASKERAAGLGRSHLPMEACIDLLGGRPRIRLLAALALSVVTSVGLLSARVFHTRTPTFAFLLWNLVLALVPLGASTLARTADRRRAGALAALLLVVWLAFFPNAPYVVTDLVHLRARSEVPLWFDAALLMSCAWNGLLLGLVSLRDAHAIVERRVGPRAGWVFALGAIVASGFGIYLGRFPRWNTWDVVTQPGRLLADVTARVLYPSEHPRTWAVTAVFAAFLFVAYVTLREVARLEPAATGSRGASRRSPLARSRQG